MPVEAGKLYSHEELSSILGCGDSKTLDTARRKLGMPFRKVGHLKLYLGDEVIQWVTNQPHSSVALLEDN